MPELPSIGDPSAKRLYNPEYCQWLEGYISQTAKNYFPGFRADNEHIGQALYCMFAEEKSNGKEG